MNALEQQNQEKIDAIIESVRGVTNCARCGRRLTDPVSVKRGMGSVCYTFSGGGVFDKDLDASDDEWTRRRKLLQAGGEIDLGVNWRYPSEGIGLGYSMRVSLRFRDGRYEAYGLVNRFGPGRSGDGDKEIVFAQTVDIREAHQAAVDAGPTYTALTYRARRQAAKAATRQMKLKQKLQPALEGVTDHVRS